MELSLNVLWFLLAVASFALIGGRGQGRNRTARRSWRQVLALACALVIFFPIISLTDDLHAGQVVMEDSNPLKRIAKSSGASGGPSARPSNRLPFLVFAGASAANPLRPLSGWTCLLEIRHLVAAPAEWPHFRGPPPCFPLFMSGFAR